MCYEFVIYPIRDTYIAHPILFGFIALTIFGDELGCTYRGCHVAQDTKFYTMASNTSLCRFAVCILLHATLLTPRIFKVTTRFLENSSTHGEKHRLWISSLSKFSSASYYFLRFECPLRCIPVYCFACSSSHVFTGTAWSIWTLVCSRNLG